jgi:lysylphosphatidylglycerol synthetase-like protein (DUF2156 family)
MPLSLVALCYGSAMVLSLYLLWHFGVKRWYWHVLSVLLALAIGLVPLREPWNGPATTLVVGWVFIFLAVWGLAAAGFTVREHPPYMHYKHH